MKRGRSERVGPPRYTPGKGGRGKPGVTVYGRRAVLEAFEAPGVVVEHVWISNEVPNSLRKELIARCAQANALWSETSARVVHAVSDDPRHDQGLAANVRLALVRPVDDLVRERPPRTRLLALDDVTNPQNVGMIVRSAVAAGMDGLLWPIDGTPWVSGLIIKSSAATVYRCPIWTCETLGGGLDALRAGGWRIYGLAGDGASDLFTLDIEDRGVFVMGAETTGVGKDAGARVDRWVSIPMDNGVESLNVAVAASLVAFRAARS